MQELFLNNDLLLNQEKSEVITAGTPHLVDKVKSLGVYIVSDLLTDAQVNVVCCYQIWAFR